MDKYVTCLLCMSFRSEPSSWRKHTSARTFSGECIYFHNDSTNKWNCALNPWFCHKHVICACDQTFLFFDWLENAEAHFPGPFQFPMFGFSVRAHHMWRTGVPVRHRSFHTTGPHKVWAASPSVRYWQPQNLICFNCMFRHVKIDSVTVS